MHENSLEQKEFFGRSEVLSLLDKRVHALKEGYRQNIAITGQCLAGKTYLLHHFLDSMKDPSILPIYVEVTDEPFSAFAERFMGTLLYAFLKLKGVDVREDFWYLLEKAQEFMPQAVEVMQEIKNELEKKNFNKAYIDILNLTSIVKRETHVRCIVIFDEFQNLSYFRIKNPFIHFGKVIMIQKDTMYIISSSDKTAIKRILAEKLSLLFGNFEVVELRGFDFNSSREFLKNRLSDFDISEGLKSFIVAFTDGNPFYLDLICSRLRDLVMASGANVINTKIVVDALEGLYYAQRGPANQYFTNKISSSYLNSSTMDVLVAIAKGLHTLRDIKESTGAGNSEISMRLRRLLELNIIFKNGNFYFFTDRGFLFWIKEVYDRSRTSLISSASRRQEQFTGDMHAYVNKFLFDLKKDCGHRIAGLFSKFRGEIIEVGQRRHRLPEFKKIDTIRLNRTSSILLAHKDKDLWTCHITEGLVREEDILSFAEENRRLKSKIINKVLIALDGIDVNATLLAKENKMWIWSLKKLNAVMDIYNQEKLIRYS